MSSTDRQYWDANATTPPLPEVTQAVTQALTQAWGNPSSMHTEGRQARRLLNEARRDIATLLGAPEDWLTLTSGGTEAINTWLAGILTKPSAGPRLVVTSAGEHPAVATTLKSWAERGQVEVYMLPTDELGRVRPADLRSLLGAQPHNRVAAVAIIAAHNETGGTQDLAALAAACRDHAVPCFFDGIQWTGKLPVSLTEIGADGWAVSFHKFGGPKGVGVLAARPGLLHTALIVGGPQEKRRRAGTENVPAIVGAAVAARLALAELPARTVAWRQQLDHLRSELPKIWPGVSLLHDAERGLPQTLLVRFPGWKGEEMVQRLDLEGVAASTGSACASGAVKASEAMLRLGVDRAHAEELVRFSLPPRAAEDSAERLLAVLKKIQAGA